eukprot:6687338-Alexandrium_andersonii.AAC.1
MPFAQPRVVAGAQPYHSAKPQLSFSFSGLGGLDDIAVGSSFWQQLCSRGVSLLGLSRRQGSCKA